MDKTEGEDKNVTPVMYKTGWLIPNFHLNSTHHCLQKPQNVIVQTLYHHLWLNKIDILVLA